MTGGRRSFMKTMTVAGAAGAAGFSATEAHTISLPDPSRPAELKISCQEGRIPGETLTDKLDFLEQHGFTGIEPGGKGLSGRVSEFKSALRGREVKVSAICAGFEGVIISEDPAVRRQAVVSMKEIMSAAGEIGSTGLIIVPAFNGRTKLGHVESREILVDLLGELGEHGRSVDSRILLEPLNRNEAFFLRLVADAAAICRDVDDPAICCMGDFWHMTLEESSDLGAIFSGGSLLHHMHIASRKSRKMPGEDEGDNYVDGFRGLKAIGYRDYVSLECGTNGDPRETIPAAAQLIRTQWAQA